MRGPDPGWSRMWELFHDAAALAPAARETFLERAAGEDRGLLDELKALLAAHGEAEKFLEPECHDATHTALGEPVPEWIGPYRVLDRIGEGGFAEVFLAEQLEPVARRVAVKVLKPGLDSRSVVARFETERQTLAMVEHPGVATVYDAGLTADGRPFVVMEYIPGRPITSYCDEQQLGLRARLDLFQQVCQAVQHAHHKGVIHRDLKPSNILVADAGDRAQVKVIDFGIAKALHAERAGTLLTEAGQRIGTPEYMSPEQMLGADLDTRTDVFALGLLLYELLVGLRPAGRPATGPAAVDTPRPSERLRSCALAASAQIASARAARDARTLARLVRGDLDWIVMKAIDPERTRRYASPAELAADLQRFLRHEPVLAQAPRALYRFAKFARRHRAGVAAAGTLLLLTPVAVVQLALTARTEQRLRLEAAEQVRVSERVSGFFARELLAGADPRRAANPDIPMRDVVDTAAAKVGEQFAREPLIEATIRQTLGDTYRSLSLFDRALPQLERAAALFMDAVGSSDMRAQRAASDLAILYVKLGRFDQAERIQRELLEVRRASLGPGDCETLVTEVNLGSLLRDVGRCREAEEILRPAQQRLEKLLGAEHEATMLATQHLAMVYVQLQDPGRAEPLLRATIAHLERNRGRDHPTLLASLAQLAQALTQQGRIEEATPLHQRVVEGTLRRVGEEHLDTALARFNLGIHYMQRNQLAEAEQLLAQAGARIEAALGPGHPTTLLARSYLGSVCFRAERYAEAEPHFAAAAAGAETLETRNPQRGVYLLDHGRCLLRIGRYEAALPLFVAGHAALVAALGEEHSRSRTALGELVALQERLGLTAEAETGRAKLRQLEAGKR